MPAPTQPAPPPRLIALGETMAMVTPARSEPLATAVDLRLHVGGAESNVASHVAALGVPAAWASALGADVLGARIRAELARHGVDTTWVAEDPDAPTGVYFKDPGNGVLYYRRGSAASRLSPGAVARVPFERADVVHVSGITLALSESCRAMMDAVAGRVAAGAGLLSFDVNHRAALWAPGEAAPVLRDYAARADIVFVGLDEAAAVWGCRTPEEVRALIPEPERLVVKDGAIGATEFARAEGAERTLFVPAIPTEVVEPVGAGDAFAGGYLCALLGGAGARGRLEAGHARAHLVLQSTSDIVLEAPDGKAGSAHDR